MRIHMTYRGILYTLSAGILFLISSRYGELMTGLCAFILAMYTASAFLAVLISACCWKTAHETAVLYENTMVIKPLHSKGCLPFCAAGTIVQYGLVLCESFHADSQKLQTLFIPIQKTQTVYHIPVKKRCRYVYKEQFIFIEDVAHFFSITIPRKRIEPSYFFCLPAAYQANTAAMMKQIIQPHTKTEQSNTDLYESRQYMPGDDPRKIHWKLYAHTNTLALRLGETEYQQITTLAVYIEEPLVVKKSDLHVTAWAFDAFIERILFFLMHAVRTGIELNLFLYSHYDSGSSGSDCSSGKHFNQYVISSDMLQWSRMLKELCAIPQPRFVKKRNSITPTNIRPYPMHTYQATQRMPLFYFYLPEITTGSIMEKQIWSQKTDSACTFFIGKSPKSRTRTMGVHALLYDSHETRKKERYAKQLYQAAERDAALCSRGHHHAYLF